MRRRRRLQRCSRRRTDGHTRAALRLTMLVLKVPHAASQCGGWKELQLRLCTRKRCALH
jgi:hypothetical protein